MSRFSSTSLKLQLIKDPNPQTINQSKQHKLNQKSRPKSVNKQLISKKNNKKKQKLTRYQDPNPQVNTKSGLWPGFGEKKQVYD